VVVVVVDDDRFKNDISAVFIVTYKRIGGLFGYDIYIISTSLDWGEIHR
jgi:hypothetical protein